MLYEMVAGKRPFFAETAAQWRDVHLKAKPLEPRTVVPSISPDLNDLTMRCLDKEPTERPENFLSIMNNLEAMLREEFHEEIPSSTPEELESWNTPTREFLSATWDMLNKPSLALIGPFP